jgi:NAD(P)-dependent dehydrogenase (short-subunit alcohol dehydrogenase family)
VNVIVTGTSSGFGQLTVRTLASNGHTVFATVRDIKGRNATAAADLAKIPNVQVIELDVTSDASVESAVADVVKRTGGAIDVLVNNAGRFSMGIQEAYRLDETKSLFETNVFGPLRMNRAVLPHMRAKRAGLIINVSSIVGRVSLPTLGTYSATKYALEALGEALRDEVKWLGIDVVLIEPGAFPTKVGDNGLYANDPARTESYGAVAQIPQKMGESLGQLFSSPQAPKPQDVADAILEVLKAPAGKRPARVVVDNLSGGPIKALNVDYGKHRQDILTAFGLA